MSICGTSRGNHGANLKCKLLQHALRKLSTHTAHVVEYVVRFVARLGPGLTHQQTQDLLMRLVSALTHQSVVIQVRNPLNKH